MRLPLAVQFNKRDLPDIVAEDELRARWSSAPWPLLFGSALQGRGVRETFAALLTPVYRSLDQRYALGAEHGLTADAFSAGALGGAPAVCAGMLAGQS
jgi:hypothetical protein